MVTLMNGKLWLCFKFVLFFQLLFQSTLTSYKNNLRQPNNINLLDDVNSTNLLPLLNVLNITNSTNSDKSGNHQIHLIASYAGDRDAVRLALKLFGGIESQGQYR